MKRIAVDMSGGDLAPTPQIDAVIQYLKDHPDAFITMVGDQAKLIGHVPSQLSD